MRGTGFGAEADAVFEIVFNTSLTGYQEILTDPSYRGQGVVFTASHIGNTGVNLEDGESGRPQVSAVVVRSVSPAVSSWRAAGSLPAWLSQHGVPGISGVDTRFLTRKLRDGGVMKAALSTCGTPIQELQRMVAEWPGLDGRDMVREVSCRQVYEWTQDNGQRWVSANAGLPAAGTHIVAYDFGIKHNIIRHLAAHGARVTVVPAVTRASDVVALQPDGIVLSNGPGDPAGLPYAVEAVRQLLQTDVPVFGICLGHQLIGMALGGTTARLKFGHHGGNHPVQDVRTRQVLITAQNHNYTVTLPSLDLDQLVVTHLSLNDGTLEGMQLRGRPVFSVQFHPEAAPGPHDAHGLFGQFFERMAKTGKTYAQAQ
jgi:carbamoyl-phosphate synthase small subunit